MRRSICVLLWATCFSQAQPLQEREVRRLMADFLTAFSNLDWPSFRSCWADAPIVFLPMAGSNGGKRIDAAAFQASWAELFESVRKSAAQRGVAKPPFFTIEPKDMQVDFVAPTVAVVTFHLAPSTGGLGRRLFVVARTGDRWKITHVHASTMPVGEAP